MKFLLRLLWAQNDFVKNKLTNIRALVAWFCLQLHKRHFIDKNFRTVFDWPKIMFQSISRPFENDAFMHWRCASYKRNLLWHYQHSKFKNWASQKILRLIPCLFENHTFCAFAPRTRDYNFFAPVPAVKLPLLPKSCVHMFISLFSETVSHKMNKLK